MIFFDKEFKLILFLIHRKVLLTLFQNLNLNIDFFKKIFKKNVKSYFLKDYNKIYHSQIL